MRGKRNYITSFRILYEDNPEIFLIELYPCNTKDELIVRERFCIETMECINKMMKKKEETSRQKEKMTHQSRRRFQIPPLLFTPRI